MSKDVVVNGENYEGISIVNLLTAAGTSAMFKDVDEINNLPNIAEIASGTFTVDTAVTGGTSGPQYVAVPHGMSGEPDGWVILPMHWYDTQDNNFALGAWCKKNKSNIAVGRRSVESKSIHNVQAVMSDISWADNTNIYPLGSTYGRFQPTYIDNDGNEGQQVYIWIAWKLAE